MNKENSFLNTLLRVGRLLKSPLKRLPNDWPQLLVVALIFTAIVGVSVWSLSQVPEKASAYEVVTTTDSQSLEKIIKNPLYLPHKALSFLALEISPSVRAVRSVSILMFIACGVALYSLLKRWHSSRVAVLTLLLFSTNATVLAISRLADPLVMLFSWSILLSLLLWLLHSTSRHIAPLAFAVLGVLLLYVPGSLYFFLILGVLFFNRLKDFFKSISLRSGIIGGLFFLVAVTPLVYAIIQNPELILSWLLLPESIEFGSMLQNALAVPSSYFYKMQTLDPLIAVGRLPIFDIASGGLFLLGAYSYYVNRSLERTKVLFLGALLAILLGTLGQVRLGVAVFLPYAFMLMAAGVSYLLDVWHDVFPNNPIARTFAFVIVTLIITTSSIYQLKKFFVVWPNTPETSETYDQSRLIQ